ncbi:MAG TPA: beta-propeller fold lactonase family protein [Bacteroidales bacterium]|nr:beta-propeller fold lactonase family protein [Bacteroidales bacterium]
MKKIYWKLVLIIGVIGLLIILIYPPFHRWARAHVNYQTAVEDHPLNCLSCHLYTQKTGLISKLINADYYSPFNLALSNDGKRLYVVAEESNTLLVVDTEKRKVTNKIKVGYRPHTVILDKDEKYGYVSNQWEDNIYVIDLGNNIVIDTLDTGNGPAGIALSSDGKFIYAVNSYTNDISVIDLSSGKEWKRLAAGNNPTGIGMSPDGRRLLVTSRRANLVPYGDPVVCELTVIDEDTKMVIDRQDMNSAYMLENIAFTPDGELALIPLIRPKNLVPSIQVEKGFMMTNGMAVIEQKPDGRVIQLLLDEPNEYFADPFDVAITPDGKRAFVSHAGVNRISVIDMDSIRSFISHTPTEMLEYYSNHLGISSKYLVKRIVTGANPKGLVLSSDGRYLYVAEHLEDRIAVISTESLETVNTIDLGGPKRITVARQGRRILNNASGTFQTQYACYTCHPDAHEDGLVYNMASKDMGRNLANTQSLRDIGDTPPFKWNGKNQTIYKQDGMRFSTVLTRNEAFNYKDLDALVAYIVTGIPYPPNLLYNPTGELNAMQLRGKALFERTIDNHGNEIPEKQRCITCHPPPYFTNKNFEDVGSLLASDDSMLFDTPHLNNIYASPPYLHHGRALTLEEIWTVYAEEDTHGAVNDFTKIELNELIEYLKSIREPEYYINESKKNKVLQAKIKNH